MKVPCIQESIAALESMQESVSLIFPKYITHIRFPKFKNITPGTRIDFEFPVTALVGPNGSGKTSVLHALYGAPNRYSTGDFWFSTEVDPIEEGEGSPNRYIYGHHNRSLNRGVETRKARVRKVRDGIPNPNYWEPTKITHGDNMADLPTLPPNRRIPGLSADRWNPVSRKVIYINFRKELSAFDKYFYFGHDPLLKRLKKKQDLIRRDSTLLKRIIESNKRNFIWRKKKISFENRLLNKKELYWVSYILGREYVSARYIRHSLFRGIDGLSVQFNAKHGKYSEAFAGSGEVAVTSVVVQILKATKGALILLDEPEVSLHPGAQERLLHFLLIRAKEQKVQIVFSTHAPSMLAVLPNVAIKVFTQDTSGTFSVIPQSHPYAAFRRLGVSHVGKIIVMVEDRLAQYVVELALLFLDESDRDQFIVDYHPGGASAMLIHRIPTVMPYGNNILFLLDGDQKQVDVIAPSIEIPETQNDNLNNIIKSYVEVSPKLIVDGDGSGNQEQRIKLQRQYIDYISTNLKHLPLSCPEEIVLRASPTLLQDKTITSSDDAKKILKNAAIKALGNKVTSEDIDSFGKTNLALVRDENEDLKTIAKTLKDFADTQ